MISVSHKHKAIFWHIHKTGGTFIEQILTNYYDFVDSSKTEINLEEINKKFNENNENDKDKEDNEDKNENKENIESWLKYGLLGDTIKNNKLSITSEEWKTYFKFAFIRNPYDRAISSYEFNNQYILYSSNINNNNTFFDFYNSSKNVDMNIFSHSFLSQYDNIKNTYNDIQIDYLAKFENMNEELIFILKNIGVPDYTKHVKFCNEKINSTIKKNITEYYDNESLVLVNDILKNDFEFLNYEKFTNVDELNSFLVKYNEPKPVTNIEDENEDIIDIDIDIDVDLDELEIDFGVLNETDSNDSDSDSNDSDSDSNDSNSDSNDSDSNSNDSDSNSNDSDSNSNDSDSNSNDSDSDLNNDESNIKLKNLTIVYNTLSKITKKITKEEIIYFCSTEFNTKNQIIYLDETVNFFDDKTDDEIRTLFTYKFKTWKMNKNEINFIINTNHRITGGFFENITKEIYFELNTFFVDNHNYKLTNDDYNFIFRKLFIYFANIKIYSKYSNSLKNESCFNIINIMNSHALKMFNNNKKNIIELLQKEISANNNYRIDTKN
jgi:hypothetical protein